MSGLSQAEIETIGQLLKLRQQTTASTASPTMDRPKLVDDYSSDDEEADPLPSHEMTRTVTTHSSGKPKKLVLTKEPIIKKKRGRPMKEKTAEELAKATADAMLKAQKKEERDAKKVQKAEAARQTQLRVAERTKSAQAKKAEKDQKALELLKKRTEIYGKMLADAEAYRAKWDL
jgi:hypothetical protein